MSMRTKQIESNIVPRTRTLGDQVRAEALRRRWPWPSVADECAKRAEKWYGRRPCKGEDLALIFSEVFRPE
jgi:hypothetical protein